MTTALASATEQTPRSTHGATMTAAEEQALWDRYRIAADDSARDELVHRYWWMLEQEARRFHARHGYAGVLDDLMSAGAVGLLQAVERFEPARGYCFGTYGRLRIRGAMRDEWRARDWMPRVARRRSRQVSAAAARVERREGRRARTPEVAAELAVDLPTMWQWQAQAARGQVELDAPPASSGPSTPTERALPAPDSTEPEHHLLRAELSSQVLAALGALPERERQVLALTYYEELSGNQIAELLGVSASRVSQLRSRAIARLRQAGGLEEYA